MKVHKGFPVGPDGRVHTTFTNNPSTLRLSSVGPNLQNIPRGKDSEVQAWVKQVFVAGPNHVFIERDYSAIEAVLVGYFAGSPRYIRMAKLGVHAYLASHLLGKPVDLSLSDIEVKAAFKLIKSQEPLVYDTAKRIVHLSNYRGTPRRMQEEYPETFKTIKEAAKLQSFYYDLFPEISSWHWDLCNRVDGSRRREPTPGEEIDSPWTLGVCHAQNPFGYVHRFFGVLDWEKVENEWVASMGEDAKRLIAFLPQSTAAAIIKQSAKAIYFNHFNPVGAALRLLVHDSILFEVHENDIEAVLRTSKQIMETPITALPLDPTWGMGEYLTIGTEASLGRSWGVMKGISE